MLGCAHVVGEAVGFVTTICCLCTEIDAEIAAVQLDESRGVSLHMDISVTTRVALPTRGELAA